MAQNQVAVVGAGAVGCYFGGMLARAGVPVTLIGRPHHMNAIAANGLMIEALTFTERVPVRTATELSAARSAGLVLYCVKTVDTETVAVALAPHLSSAAVVISMQNGVDNVARIERASGLAAIPAAVYVAAAMIAPGYVKHSGRGDLILGEVPGGPDPRPAATLFGTAGIPCRISATIERELWAKMTMNCAYNAISALTRSRYGRMIADAAIRELIDQVVGETVVVAQAEGVPLTFEGMRDAAYKLGGEAMPGAMSSTAQDIERGKPTEIDSLNGYLVRRGEELGIPTPINRTLWSLVKLLEKAGG